METRRKGQAYKDKKEQRRLVRVIKSKFKVKDAEVERINTIKRLVNDFYGQVDFGWSYYEMIEWCHEKDVIPNILRYRNFLRKRIEWDKDKKDNNIDLDDEERKQTKELLKKYGRHKE